MTKDPKVEAMRNRAPRIVGTGVPYGEFEELIDGIDRWEDWCAAWSARAAIHEEIGREALASGHGLSAGHHLNTAALIYHFGKFTFIDDMAQLRAAHQKAVECMTLALPHFLPPGAHIQIPYEGKFLAANLRRPEGQAPAPVVILVSGLDAAKEELHDTEQFFLERGMATLSVDGPGQGEAEYDFPLRYDFEVPMGAAIDWVKREATSIGRGSDFWVRVSAAISRPGLSPSKSGSRPASATVFPTRFTRVLIKGLPASRSCIACASIAARWTRSRNG